jgi:hypothetical protein
MVAPGSGKGRGFGSVRGFCSGSDSAGAGNSSGKTVSAAAGE